MTEKTLTTENIKPALDALRGELAPWPVVAKKQDRLNTAQLNAANSGITSSLVAQIIANTAAIRALESAITGTGLRALVVSSLPAVGTTGILYIVPVTTYDPDTDADVVNYSNEYLWIVAPDAPVTEGYYEQVGQTGIVINNGQLNITVNGTSVGTFTANQSGDTTAAITVPTNADYVDLSTNQTIAGVKTFSSTINGTASKAIADEDGTSIKTGYVNVAGNQTVWGQKTWSGIQFFNSDIYRRHTTYEIGNTPASNVVLPFYFADKVNVHTGYVRNVVLTTGKTQSELLARNKFTNGALSPTGTDVSSTLQVEVQSNGDKTLYFDGSIRNNILPNATNSYSLGSSSYQWSSVYAQTYYYNGTQWGLDINNTWTGNNEYKSVLGLTGGEIWFKDPAIEDITSNPSSDISKSIFQFYNKTQTQYTGGIIERYLTDGTHQINISCLGFQLNNYGVYYAHSFYFEAKRDGTGSFFPSLNNVNLGTSTNQWKSVYAQSYYYNGAAWGLDKNNVWTNTNTFQQNVTYERTNFFHQAVNPSYILKDTGLEKGSLVPTAHTAYPGLWHDKNNAILGYMRFVEYDTGKQTAEFRISNLIKNGALDPTGSTVNCTVNLELQPSGEKSLIPEQNNDINLGTSTNKWKTLNGVNPGALSLPGNSYIDISGDVTVRDGSAANNLTASCDGWIAINSFATWLQISDDTTLMATTGAPGADGFTQVFLPVRQGDSLRVVINQTNTLFQSFRLIPCAGNV